MFKMKRIVIAATAVLAVSAHSAAASRILLEPSAPPGGGSHSIFRIAPSGPLYGGSHSIFRIAAAGTSHDAGQAVAGGAGGAGPVSIKQTTSSAPQGFQWGDAGIGAVSVLVLISLGSAATLVLRRRAHHPMPS